MPGITLDTKLVGDIRGDFIVPSYQRGYRWGKDEVNRLLEDIIKNGQNNYCLQPIVIRTIEDKYELIDGQQRLTTLFLIYKYLNKISKGFLSNPKFRLKYDTRDDNENFLLDLDESKKELTIDYFFIIQAYETIDRWFTSQEKKETAMTNINKYFDENVKVIWYEVDDSQEPISLFTRLNIGKIALTSAELVKAMFLSSTSEIPKKDKLSQLQQQLAREKREEISLQWDNIEKDLHYDKLWFFLTNNSEKDYQTRIDLILDMMVKKPSNVKEKYFTFFEFDKMRQSQSLESIWSNIQNSFLVLYDWFENHELYHKIGYLIASDTLSLNEIFELSNKKTKQEFQKIIDHKIISSIKSNEDYSEMSYENKTHYKSISKLLLLFNVESVRQNGEQTQWFPFDKFKFQKGVRNSWSLEHIHAQQSDGMKTQEIWKEWLSLHLESIHSLGDNENIKLMEEVKLAINTERLERSYFEEIQQKVFNLFTSEGSIEYMHSISNLALLNTSDNAALNNSTFDVKRNEIIKMDKKGKFIPFCTKMIFLKYYTPSETSQLHFWGQSDREAYIKAINNTLSKYLEEPIQFSRNEETSNGN
jgi:hypothetical protein